MDEGEQRVGGLGDGDCDDDEARLRGRRRGTLRVILGEFVEVKGDQQFDCEMKGVSR